jgi:uncharacterized membrane protein YeaQ/YmgE (transglycosylase-associated protein family)
VQQIADVKSEVYKERRSRAHKQRLMAQFCLIFMEREGKKSMTLGAIVLADTFSVTGLVIWLIIGLIAGFVASRIMGAGGYGLVGDIVVGLIGAFIGGIIANLLIPGATNSLIGSIIVAIIGACILIWLFRLVTGGRSRRGRL